jgi:lantibiotic biosynthesis protein
MNNFDFNRGLDKIEELSNFLLEYSNNVNITSLYMGSPGEALFLHAYNLIDNRDSQKNRIEININNVIHDIQNDPNPNYTFCSGLAGVVWLLNYLREKKYCQFDDDFFEDIDYILATKALEYLSYGQYDFLHGGGGIIFTLLERPEKNKELLIALTQTLLNIRIQYNGSKTWRYFTYEKEKRNQIHISLGLSHGIPSLMVLLGKLYRANILQEECLIAINESYNFLKQLKNSQQDEKNYAFYPTLLIDNESIKHTSRLGWCYGDLGIGIGLYTCGKNINNKEMMEEAISIYDYYCTKINDPKFGLADCSFCHGTAGVAHLFYRMYLNTTNENYKQAADYWIKILLEMGIHQDGYAGYKYWTKEGWQNKSDLLEGIIGVGLVLATQLGGMTPDWDSCFLLS